MRKRRVLALLLLLAALLPLTGCRSLLAELLQGHFGARQAERSEMYHCGYFGLRVTVPEDWYVVERNEVNLTAEPTASDDVNALEASEPERDYFFYEMLAIANRRSSGDPSHTLFDLSVYHDPEFTSVGSFADYWIGVVEEPDEDKGEHVFRQFAWEPCAGREMLRLGFEVTYEESVYREDYVLCQVGEYDFLMAYVNYWPEDEQSIYDAGSIIERALEFVEPTQAGEFTAQNREE